MNAAIQYIKKSSAELLQYSSLIIFTLFTLYFSVSYYRLYNMKELDLKELTHKVDAVWLKEAKGKQGKPEVWIDFGQSGKYRVTYGNKNMLHDLMNEIKKDDLITVYLKKEQHAFIDLGKDNDILQIAKNGEVVYSLDVPQKNFHDYYFFSAIMSLLLPIGCVFYWTKSKHNAEAYQVA